MDKRVKLPDLELTTSASNVDSEEENGPQIIDRILTRVILQTLMGFLEYNDLKAFRLVCVKWKEISEICFRKRSKINFDFRENFSFPANIKLVGQEALLPSKKFMAKKRFFFHTVFEEEIPFHSIEFRNFVQWTDMITIGKMMNSKPGVLKRLKLKSVMFVSKKGLYLTKQDICHFLPLLAGHNITKLELESKGNTKLYVTLSQLKGSSLKDLSLESCVVVLDEQKIVLKSLELKNVQFMKGEEMCSTVIVNDFLNFAKLNRLTLITEYGEKDVTSLILLLNGNCKMSHLELERISSGIEPCNWEIDTLILKSSQFPLDSDLRIQKLAIDTTVDIRQLPISLERLSFNSRVAPVDERQVFHLPKLKYFYVNNVSCLPYAYNCTSHCSKLEDLELDYHCLSCDIELDKIPKSVRRIKLNLNQGKFIGQKIENLEKLVIIFSSLVNQNSWIDFISKILDNSMTARNIVIQGHELAPESVDKLLQKQFESLTVGTLNWEGQVLENPFIKGLGVRNYELWNGNEKLVNENDLHNLNIYQLVERKSSCYVFRNGKGEPLSEKQFLKMCQL